MSKTLKMFLSAMMMVILTIITYYTIAHFAGGVGALIQKAFGGLISALSIVILLSGIGGFGWYVYWLSERRSSGKTTSGLHAVISMITLVVVALVGIGWVKWSWSLLWLLPLLIPALLAAWAISAVAQNVYAISRPAPDLQSSLDDLL